ncbi:hypothetical protein [Bacillus sp. YC2]|uniref:hypothetical protein n=1 Tax=Bacillus sp. YC2 TaxID=2861287 RepID=UPI0037C1AAB9
MIPIFLFDEEGLYLDEVEELYPDSVTGEYKIPEYATDIPPLKEGAGMWRPKFDKLNRVWIETADQEYKDSLAKDQSDSNPLADQLNNLGQQLANEKLARKAAEQAQQSLGMQLAAEVLAKQEAKHVNQSLGEQLAALKLDVMNLKGEMKNEKS